MMVIVTISSTGGHNVGMIENQQQCGIAIATALVSWG